MFRLKKILAQDLACKYPMCVRSSDSSRVHNKNTLGAIESYSWTNMYECLAL